MSSPIPCKDPAGSATRVAVVSKTSSPASIPGFLENLVNAPPITSGVTAAAPAPRALGDDPVNLDNPDPFNKPFGTEPARDCCFFSAGALGVFTGSTPSGVSFSSTSPEPFLSFLPVFFRRSLMALPIFPR